ncbi:MAG: polyprenyl synthetase family protein [Pyrinomonadaceae bacterium]|nr:polyprenyl synthetase family protein [Pyrinomonadaceae bacterium]
MSTRAEAKGASEGLWDYVAQVRPHIERALLQKLPLAHANVETLFNDALRYSLFPGGKRLRPVLTLLGAEITGGRALDVLPAAVAVEYIHNSSLIFDDLPCMDDAMKRRGQSTLHARYGEGLAVLVALALMNASYGLIFEVSTSDKALAVNAHAELVECIGARGMVAGQSVDLAQGRATNVASINGRDGYDSVRNLKTSALIRLALRVGAILSGANERQLKALSTYAEYLGQAYQTRDDMLDMKEDAQLATTAARRMTFALERGERDTRLRVATLIAGAKNALVKEFGQTPPTLLLCELADYVVNRES